MPVRCEIVSQDKIVFQDDVDMVVVPGADGEFGILPNHAPVLSVLKYGVVRVRKSGKEELFTVAGGVIEVLPKKITILADAAENVEEIDLQRAEAARERAEQILKQGLGKDPDEYLALQAAIRRSNLRIDAARRYQVRRQR